MKDFLKQNDVADGISLASWKSVQTKDENMTREFFRKPSNFNRCMSEKYEAT